ncbi:efflux RND transporter permease subunit [bacterium]|nr:efflux RND transporter permease subunit [bacterium]
MSEKAAPSPEGEPQERLDWGSKVVASFLTGFGPAILGFLALAAGIIALYIIPREEEPQIVVPLADVFVTAPGLSAEQVERQISTPLENLLYQIDGVEYVYSMSRPGQSVVTVRFYVGEDREDSLVKIYNQIHSNSDKVPSSVSGWVVKPLEVDDVPIVIAMLWSEDPEKTGDHELRRLAEEVVLKLHSIQNTNRVEVTGGRPREIRVELNPEALAARRTTPMDVAWALQVSNDELPAGQIDRMDEAILIETGEFFHNATELGNAVVNVVDGVPVYLNEVATVIDGPIEPDNYTWMGFGAASGENDPKTGIYPAVALSVAKRKGSNAVWVANDVVEMMKQLDDELFPPEVHYRIIRNYGETANQKVNDLVSSLLVAIITVVIFIGVVMGWRAALVVGLAVPICYGATLGLNMLTGYTINRVTLFALILALGLLVDDPITGIDNIDRYLTMGKYKKRKSVLLAIQEVRNALIMSTIAIVLSFIPMSFITGMMGPYMGPMAANVPLAVVMSTFVAFLITPWMSMKLLRPKAHDQKWDIRNTMLYKIYNLFVRPLVKSRKRAWLFVGIVVIAFFASAALPAFRLVPLKLLPFDNKNEFQVIVDMPEGTTLERTQAVTQAVSDYLREVPEVVEFAGFVGLSSPIDFNGMVRHYYLRHGGNVADLRVTLLDKTQRKHQSHDLILRIRKDIDAISEREGANIKLVEVPPGPPVISTVTVELYGEPATPYEQIEEAAFTLADRLKKEPLVVDIDTSVEADQKKLIFVTDKEKASLSGVATEDISGTVNLAIDGMVASDLEIPSEANPLPIRLQLPVDRRSTPHDVLTLFVRGRPGIVKQRQNGGLVDAPQPLVQLGEIGEFQQTVEDKTIYHKNLKRVSYVFAELAGRAPADAILDVMADKGRTEAVDIPLEGRNYLVRGSGIPWDLPSDVNAKWNGEGEWKITLRVFRDLGIAFGAALLGIMVVLMIQTGSGVISLIIMTAIPLTMIGIMPGFWLLNSIGPGPEEFGGFPNPTFFTATAMIGMIALAGIVVRNSLILVEFIHQALREGMELEEALVQAGAIRMRPVFLTAGTTLLGNLVITLDPIFNGLAWSIIFGIAASTLFTLAVIPVVYYLVYGRKEGHGLPVERKEEE